MKVHKPSVKSRKSKYFLVEAEAVAGGIPAGNYMFIANGVVLVSFIVNFEHISQLVLVFLFLTFRR